MFSIQMSVTKAGTSYFNLGKKNMSWVHADCVEFSHPKNHLEKWYFLDLTWKPFLFDGGYVQKVPASLEFFPRLPKKKTEESHGSFGSFCDEIGQCKNSINSLWVSWVGFMFQFWESLSDPSPEAWTHQVVPQNGLPNATCTCEVFGSRITTTNDPHAVVTWKLVENGDGLVVDKDVVPMNGNMITYEMKIGPTSWRSVGCPEKLGKTLSLGLPKNRAREFEVCYNSFPLEPHRTRHLSTTNIYSQQCAPK